MKKLVIKTVLLLLVACSMVLAPKVPALAFSPLGPACDQGANDSKVCKDAPNTANPIAGKDGVITKATQILAIITGIASIVVIIVGGFRFVTSGGDSNKVATARSTILYAVIGLAIALLAETIVVFVLNKL